MARKNTEGVDLWFVVSNPPDLEIRLESANWLLSDDDVNPASIWIDDIRLRARGEILEGGRVVSLKVIAEPASNFDPYLLLSRGKELYVKLKGWHKFSLDGSKKAIPALRKCVSTSARSKVAHSKDWQTSRTHRATSYIVRLYKGSTKQIIRLRRKSSKKNRTPNRWEPRYAKDANLQRERLRPCLPKTPKIPERKVDLGLVPSKHKRIDRPTLRKFLVGRGHDLNLIDEHINAENYYECLVEYNLITKQIIRECFEMHLRGINFFERP